MKAVFILIAFIFANPLLSSPLWSQQNRNTKPAFPSLEVPPIAYEYARRVASSPLNWRDLAEASLWLSSVNAGAGAEEKAAAYLDRISAAVEELAAQELPADTKERGEFILTFMHSKFLKTYSEHQTRVDEIFVSGRYNCVSSSVLYMILGLSVGLDVGGVMTKQHAFATVNIGGTLVDVETTNRFGFDPGNRKEFHDAFGTVTGFAYVPAQNYRDRTAITPVEMASLILSNRISAHERANRYADAVPLAIYRTIFLSQAYSSGTNAQNQHKAEFFEDPHKDMMSRLFNLGAHLLKAGKEDDVIAWIEYIEGTYPNPERWQELVKAAANNKLAKLIRAKKIPDARVTLTSLRPKLSNENYNELDLMMLEAEAGDKVNTIRNPGDVQAALAFIEENWNRLNADRREEIRLVAILSEADRIGKTRNWAGGLAWLEDAIKKYGSNQRLENALKQFRQNRVSELHNEFAALYNKKNFEAAKAMIEKALEEFPGERQLVQNLDLVNKALEQN